MTGLIKLLWPKKDAKKYRYCVVFFYPESSENPSAYVNTVVWAENPDDVFARADKQASRIIKIFRDKSKCRTYKYQKSIKQLLKYAHRFNSEITDNVIMLEIFDDEKIEFFKKKFNISIDKKEYLWNVALKIEKSKK